MPAPVDHDAKRAEIARLAATVIAEVGLDRATIREVAGRTGFSSTVVTHYFATKRDMLFAAYRHASSAAQVRFDSWVERNPDDPMACLEALLPLDEESHSAWRLYFQFWPMADHDPEMANEQRWWSRNAVGLAADLIRRAFPQETEVVQKAELAMSALQGIALQALFDPDTWPPERQVAMWRAHTALLLGPR